MTNQDELAEISSENLAHFSAPQGQGLLRLLANAAEERWSYLTELLQNALDAGATSISIQCGPTSLSFEHNGTSPFDRKSVEAMSLIGRSTKGFDTIGFMGVGFKSVFQRVSDVHVSGFGWTFTYSIVVGRGQLGERRPNWLGAVCPKWNDEAPRPSEGFTTRFTLEGILEPDDPLSSDIEAIFERDNTIFSILAYRGVRNFQIDNMIWRLDCSSEGGTFIAEANQEKGGARWALFPVRYAPSEAARRRLVESRRPHVMDDETVDYSGVARTREVIGILPLDARGEPEPPAEGAIFATMKTKEVWPFRIHIHADWLLRVTRSGLPELETNEWQEDIVAQLPQVIASYLDWLIRNEPSVERIRIGFSVLALPNENGSSSIERLTSRLEWTLKLQTSLRQLRMFPSYERNRLRLLNSTEVRIASREWRGLSNDAGLFPDLLFGVPTVATALLGSSGEALLDRLGLVRKLSAADVRSADQKLRNGWVSALGVRVHDGLDWMATILATLHNEQSNFAEWRSAEVVLTESGTWISPDTATLLPDSLEARGGKFGAATEAVRKRIAVTLPSSDHTVNIELMQLLRTDGKEWAITQRRRDAQRWLKQVCNSIAIVAEIRKALTEECDATEPNTDFVVRAAQWARIRLPVGDARLTVTHVLVNVDGELRIEPVDNALIADPYVSNGRVRRRFWYGYAPISDAYFASDPAMKTSVAAWAEFFGGVGIRGPLAIEKSKARFARGALASIVSATGMASSTIQPANDGGYDLINHRFNPEPDEEQIKWLGEMIDSDPSQLVNKGRRVLQSFYHTKNESAAGASSVARYLSTHHWVPSTDGLAVPHSVLPKFDEARPDIPVATLQMATIALLAREGVTFGEDIPGLPAIARLKRTGNSLDSNEIASLIDSGIGSANTDADWDELREVLRGLSYPAASIPQRIPFDRLVAHAGSGYRSSFGGWIRSLDEIGAALKARLTQKQLDLQIPPTTSANQAIQYIKSVWDSAVSQTQPRPSDVRDSLGRAFSIIVEESAGDSKVDDWWKVAREMAILSTTSGWVKVRSATVFFDDRPSDRFRDFLLAHEFVATSSHLGATASDQLLTAGRLGLKILSHELRPSWLATVEETNPSRASLFDRSIQAFARVAEVDLSNRPLRLKSMSRIAAVIRGKTHEVPVRAVGDEVFVSGRATDFGFSLTRMVLDHIGRSQDADLAIHAALILQEIDDFDRWRFALTRLAHSYEFDLADLTAPLGVSSLAGDTLSPPLIRLEPASTIAERISPSQAAAPNNPESASPKVRGNTEAPTAAQPISEVLPISQPVFVDATGDEVSPDQMRRGLRGEKEILRRLSTEQGWGGLRLVEDVRATTCGFDFACVDDEGKKFAVELKTFAPNGRIIISPNEYQAMQSLGESIGLLCLVDDGGEPAQWKGFLLRKPQPVIDQTGVWKTIRRIEVDPTLLISRA